MNDGTYIVEYFVDGAIGIRCTAAADAALPDPDVVITPLVSLWRSLCCVLSLATAVPGLP